MNTFCGYYNQALCRSCTRIELDYSNQINDKELKLKKILVNNKPDLLPSVLSKKIAFRNKAKLVVTGELNQPVIGLWGEDDLDQGRELLNCPLHHPKINELLDGIKEFIVTTKLVPYQISKRTGELKGLIIFYSEGSNELSLRVVVRSKESLSRIKKHVPELLSRYPELVCVSANIQPVPHAILEGEEEVYFTERNYLHHYLGPYKFQISPQAFLQTNQEVALKLYETAASWIDELRPQKFCELFCGQGPFSFFAASSFQQGLGVEINRQAVNQANAMASNIGLHHLSFKCADAKDVEREISEFKPDLILVNPPRKGLGKSIEVLLKERPHHIIYSSCSIESLESDLKQLNAEYEITKVRLFDMFPHTNHFESLILLTRKI